MARETRRGTKKKVIKILQLGLLTLILLLTTQKY